jgi:8-oxo-dGTP diphosphatase
MDAYIVSKSVLYNSKLDKFLLVQRSSDDDVGADSWENVGGNLEDGETPEEAMRREIREEVGITDVEIGRVAYVTLLQFDKPCLIIAYYCKTTTEEVKLSEEHESYVWADREMCKKLLPKGIMEDYGKNGVFEHKF